MVHSLVAANKTFCFYMAESADDVRKHAQVAGIPANTVTEIDSWKAVAVPGTVPISKRRVFDTAHCRAKCSQRPPAWHAEDLYVWAGSAGGEWPLEGEAGARRSIWFSCRRAYLLTRATDSCKPILPRTLSLISTKGPDAFYRGHVGAAIAEAVAKGGGIITAEDFARYTLMRELKPVECDYRGYPSSRPVGLG